jgi:hypothetical protein
MADFDSYIPVTAISTFFGLVMREVWMYWVVGVEPELSLSRS